jgi:hypothetical protein
MLKRSTIFLGLMLTGSLAAATLSGGKGDSAPAAELSADQLTISPPSANEFQRTVHKLDLDKLVRTEVIEPEQNPFAGKSWYAPPPKPALLTYSVSANTQTVVSPEVAHPVAPPVPFLYVGWMQEDEGHAIAYLTQGSRAYSVAEGEVVGGNYRLESITPGQLVLTYLPMESKQMLNIGGAAASVSNVAIPNNAFSPDIGNYNLPTVGQLPDGGRIQ